MARRRPPTARSRTGAASAAAVRRRGRRGTRSTGRRRPSRRGTPGTSSSRAVQQRQLPGDLAPTYAGGGWRAARAGHRGPVALTVAGEVSPGFAPFEAVVGDAAEPAAAHSSEDDAAESPLPRAGV